MKKKIFIVLAVITLVVTLYIHYYYMPGGPGDPEATRNAETVQEVATETVEAQPEAAPEMAPETEEAEEVEAPTVEITPEQQQLIGVKTTEVKVRPLEKVIRTVGRVQYNERGLATINMKVGGWVEKLHANYAGRYIQKGAPMAEVYSPELVAAQEELLVALRWARDAATPDAKKDAEALLEASRRRLRLLDISDAQIKKLEETGVAERTLTVYSPASGYVIEKMALEGMRVMPGEKLFDVADLSSVWLIADIYEYEMPFVSTGLKAKVALSYMPGREFDSKIDYVYPTLSAETRTARVRFVLPNPKGELKPQMFGNIEIRIPIGEKLSIPDDSIIDTGTRQIVYVDKGEGYFEPREVMLGLSAEGFREVTMGLKEGEKVASSAAFLIDSEAQLRGVAPLPGGHKH